MRKICEEIFQVSLKLAKEKWDIDEDHNLTKNKNFSKSKEILLTVTDKMYKICKKF